MTVKLICDEVSRVSRQPVGVGVVPLNVLTQNSVTADANNEPAREVLVLALSGLHWNNPNITVPRRKLVWRLFYGPDVQKYALNLTVATGEIKAPNGGRVVAPIN